MHNASMALTDIIPTQLDPVTLALSLMDDSSVGRGSDYQLFLRTMRNLDTALKSITNGNLSYEYDSILPLTSRLTYLMTIKNITKGSTVPLVHLAAYWTVSMVRLGDTCGKRMKGLQLTEIIDSHAKVLQIKSNLVKAKQVLQERRADVLNLFLRSKQRKEMISILDTM